MGAFGAKISIPTEHGSVGIEFWVRFGLMLGHLEGMLGPCWAFVGSFGGLLGAFGARISIPTEHGSVGIEFWVGFGLMLGHLEGMLGLCWAYVRPLLAHLGVCWRLSGLTFQSQRKHGSVGIEFWDILGQFRAYAGPFGGYVGCLLEYKTMLESNLATHLGLATRMQKKFL